MKAIRSHLPLLAAVTVGLACLIDSNLAAAADVTTGEATTRRVPVAQIFTFLLLMLGPFKIIGPFARITKGADAKTTRRIALLSILFSSVALIVAAFLGEGILSSYGIPLPVLGLAAGIILFLVALQGVLQQFTPHVEDSTGPATTPTIDMALSPLAFPTIVTPYGIAALVVFLSLSPDLQGRLTIGAIVLVIMLLNLAVMFMTRYILPVLRVVLPILGAVLGVVQVALGLQVINRSLAALGVL